MRDSLATIFGLLQIAIVLLGLIGYVMCVVKFVRCDFEPNYKAEIVYGVGTFTGLGMVVGWIDFGK